MFQERDQLSAADVSSWNNDNKADIEELDPENLNSVYQDARLGAISLYILNTLLAIMAVVMFVFLVKRLCEDMGVNVVTDVYNAVAGGSPQI